MNGDCAYSSANGDWVCRNTIHERLGLAVRNRKGSELDPSRLPAGTRRDASGRKRRYSSLCFRLLEDCPSAEGFRYTFLVAVPKVLGLSPAEQTSCGRRKRVATAMVNNIWVKRDCCVTKGVFILVFVLITNRRHTTGSAQELSQSVVHGSVLFEPPSGGKLF